MEKHAFGEAGVIHLVLGMISIFGSIGGIVYVYGRFEGIIFSKPQEGAQFVITNPEEFASLMLMLWFLILVTGVLGGFELGRYVQTEFTKRRKQT